jgi:hypothetical protein
VVVPLKTKEHQQLQLSTYDRPQYGVPKKERKKGVRKSCRHILVGNAGMLETKKKLITRNQQSSKEHSNVATTFECCPISISEIDKRLGV